jgi:hypothetical protein
MPADPAAMTARLPGPQVHPQNAHIWVVGDALEIAFSSDQNGGDVCGVDRSLGPGAVTLSEPDWLKAGLRSARQSELAVAVGGWLRYLPALAAAPSPGGHILPHLSAVCDHQRLRVARRGGTLAYRGQGWAGSRTAVEGLVGGPADDAAGWVPRLTEDLRGPGNRDVPIPRSCRAAPRSRSQWSRHGAERRLGGTAYCRPLKCRPYCAQRHGDCDAGHGHRRSNSWQSPVISP